MLLNILISLTKTKQIKNLQTQRNKNPVPKPKDITPEFKISYAKLKPRVWPSDAPLKIEAYLKEMQMCK